MEEIKIQEQIEKLKMGMKDDLLDMFRSLDNTGYLDVNHFNLDVWKFYYIVEELYSGHREVLEEIRNIRDYHLSGKD